MPTQLDLLESYYWLRRKSPALKKDSAIAKLDGQRWIEDIEDKDILRRKTKDGWELRVYKIEGGVEACIISPTGESKTYS